MYGQSKEMIDMYELNPSLGLPLSIFPRYPPGVSLPNLSLMNQNHLKDKFFHDNASISYKLHDFNQMYQKLANGLFEMAYPALPPGHPLYSRIESAIALQNENLQLRKENIELKKQLRKNQNSKSKI
jgi:hypothetical protein